MLAICKHQYIKKYIKIANTQKDTPTRHRNVRTTVFVPSSWKDVYIRVSLRNTHHLTNLVHSAHGARAIWNTVPTAAHLLTIHHTTAPSSESWISPVPRPHPLPREGGVTRGWGLGTRLIVDIYHSTPPTSWGAPMVLCPDPFWKGSGQRKSTYTEYLVYIQKVSPLIIPPTELWICITHLKAWQQCHLQVNSVLSLCRRSESIRCMHY